MAPRVEGEIISRTRRFVTLSVSLAAVALSTVACSGAAGMAGSTFTFRVSKVTVVNHNDSLIYGVRDEPFVHNLWFRVKAGVANSAHVGIAGDRANAYNDLGNGQSHAYVGGEQAPASFSGVRLLDVADLLNPADPLEIVGTWTWEMDQDDVSDLGVAVNTVDGSTSTDSDGTVTNYDWNFGDFTSGSGALTGHTFTSSGTFPVTLTVTDNHGDSSSSTINVAVGGAPTDGCRTPCCASGRDTTCGSGRRPTASGVRGRRPLASPCDPLTP